MSHASSDDFTQKNQPNIDDILKGTQEVEYKREFMEMMADFYTPGLENYEKNTEECDYDPTYSEDFNLAPWKRNSDFRRKFSEINDLLPWKPPFRGHTKKWKLDEILNDYSCILRNKHEFITYNFMLTKYLKETKQQVTIENIQTYTLQEAKKKNKQMIAKWGDCHFGMFKSRDEFGKYLNDNNQLFCNELILPDGQQRMFCDIDCYFNRNSAIGPNKIWIAEITAELIKLVDKALDRCGVDYKLNIKRCRFCTASKEIDKKSDHGKLSIHFVYNKFAFATPKQQSKFWKVVNDIIWKNPGKYAHWYCESDDGTIDSSTIIDVGLYDSKNPHGLRTVWSDKITKKTSKVETNESNIKKKHNEYKPAGRPLLPYELDESKTGFKFINKKDCDAKEYLISCSGVKGLWDMTFPKVEAPNDVEVKVTTEKLIEIITKEIPDMEISKIRSSRSFELENKTNERICPASGLVHGEVTASCFITKKGEFIYWCWSSRCKDKECRVKVLSNLAVKSERKHLPFDAKDVIKTTINGKECEVLYSWMIYKREVMSKIYKNYDHMIREVGKNLYRVMAIIDKGEPEYITKDSKKDLMHSTKNDSFMKDVVLRYKVEKKKKPKKKKSEKKRVNQIHREDGGEGESDDEEGRNDSANESDDEDDDKMQVQTKNLWQIKGDLHRLDLIPTYCGIVNDPDSNDPTELNLWKGFKAKLVEGWTVISENLQFFLDFLKNVICGKNEISYRYLLRLFKEWLFNPGNKVPICLYLYGDEGTGKTSLFEFFQKHVMGEHVCVPATGLDEVLGDFNGHLVGNKLCLIDEMAESKHSRDFDKLKGRISNKTMILNRKGKDQIIVNCFLQYIIATNNIDAMKPGRRLFAMKVLLQELSYYAELRRRCFNDDIGNEFYTYLNSLDLSDVVLRDVPLTELRYTLIQRNLSVLERFLKYCYKERAKLVPGKKTVEISICEDDTDDEDKDERKNNEVVEDEIKDEEMEVKVGEENNIREFKENKIETQRKISAAKLYETYLKWRLKSNVAGDPQSTINFGTDLKTKYLPSGFYGRDKQGIWYDLEGIPQKIWGGDFQGENDLYLDD